MKKKKKSFRKLLSLIEEIGSCEIFIINDLIVEERYDVKGFDKKLKWKDKFFMFKFCKG